MLKNNSKMNLFTADRWNTGLLISVFHLKICGFWEHLIIVWDLFYFEWEMN